MKPKLAAPLETTHWFNTDGPITLDALRGKVVLIEAFQMLCPGCVSHGLPLANRVFETFSRDDVAVIGLHTVFEHHEAQGGNAALEAFLHEYKIRFPVGVDAPSPNGGPPKTMRAYNLQGTPSLLLIDREGRLRKQTFGLERDLILGAEIMSLMREGAGATFDERAPDPHAAGCDDAACAIPNAQP